MWGLGGGAGPPAVRNWQSKADVIRDRGCKFYLLPALPCSQCSWLCYTDIKVCDLLNEQGRQQSQAGDKGR